MVLHKINMKITQMKIDRFSVAGILTLQPNIKVLKGLCARVCVMRAILKMSGECHCPECLAVMKHSSTAVTFSAHST